MSRKDETTFTCDLCGRKSLWPTVEAPALPDCWERVFVEYVDPDNPDLANRDVCVVCLRQVRKVAKP